MNSIQDTKKDLLIICKKDGVNRIRLNIDNVIYIIDRDEEYANVNIIDVGGNIISERVKLPKPHFCKAKTISNKRCKNKTYNNFCHVHSFQI